MPNFHKERTLFKSCNLLNHKEMEITQFNDSYSIPNVKWISVEFFPILCSILT